MESLNMNRITAMAKKRIATGVAMGKISTVELVLPGFDIANKL
jgi:hypothetical protein